LLGQMIAEVDAMTGKMMVEAITEMAFDRGLITAGWVDELEDGNVGFTIAVDLDSIKQQLADDLGWSPREVEVDFAEWLAERAPEALANVFGAWLRERQQE